MYMCKTYIASAWCKLLTQGKTIVKYVLLYINEYMSMSLSKLSCEIRDGVRFVGYVGSNRVSRRRNTNTRYIYTCLCTFSSSGSVMKFSSIFISRTRKMFRKVICANCNFIPCKASSNGRTFLYSTSIIQKLYTHIHTHYVYIFVFSIPCVNCHWHHIDVNDNFVIGSFRRTMCWIFISWLIRISPNPFSDSNRVRKRNET